MRNEIAKHLEKRTAPPQALDLLGFADREKLMEQAWIAGLSPQELEFCGLFTTIGVKPKRVAADKGERPRLARQAKHRIKNKLRAAGV
jgi:hypothetical protein